MAEERASPLELDGLEKHFNSLLDAYASDESRRDSESFCPSFCKLVEAYSCHCREPLPQLDVLQVALRYFAQGSDSFSSNCDHVHYTLSSLALSVFELLLFFDQKDVLQHHLKDFNVTFQECHSALARHQNVHMLQLKELILDGGPWVSPVWQAALSESTSPQDEVDDLIGSELPVFLELRVHYLLMCRRLAEATALAGRCARHPIAGQHLFFLQAYLTCLYKGSRLQQLNTEAATLGGKEAVKIICSLDDQEGDELLLSLTRAFLSQQLLRGDMRHLWDLVFIWSKLHRRLDTSKQALLDECGQLLRSATNISCVFPFIRVILGEVGAEGIQFCVELCTSALQSGLPCDSPTRSLLYKAIGGLLPGDLEVCRVCALLVFFQERTADACRTVLLLYARPDQEYSAEGAAIGNHVRFDILQVLKRGMCFDPEFWNMAALRSNCLQLLSDQVLIDKLLSDKLLSAALEEIVEETWLPSYCAKEAPLRCISRPTGHQTEPAATCGPLTKKRQLNEDINHTVAKRHKRSPDTMRPPANHVVKTKKKTTKMKKGSRGTRRMEESPCESFRRSFWQLDKPQRRFASQFGSAEHRRATRLSEKVPEKRQIRQPRWLLEDSGTLEENGVPTRGKREGVKHDERRHWRQRQAPAVRGPGSGPIKHVAKRKAPVNCHLTVKENGTSHRKSVSADCLRPASPTQVILELSQPDNELAGTFTEDSCARKRGFPQVLLYKPTACVPVAAQPAKAAAHGKEVILRARDTNAFVSQLHPYARRRRGKGAEAIIPASVSTITRSSGLGGPPKQSPGQQCCDTPVVEMKVTIASQTTAEVRVSDTLITGVISQSESSTDEALRAPAVSQNSTVDGACVVAAENRSPKTSAVDLTAVDEVVSEVPGGTSKDVPTAQSVFANGHFEENSLFPLSTACEQDNDAITDFQNTNAREITNVLNLTLPEDSSLVASDGELHTHPLKPDPADAVLADPNFGENSFAPVEMSEDSFAPKELHGEEDERASTLKTEEVTELTSEPLLPDTGVSKEDASPTHKPICPCETLSTSHGPATTQQVPVVTPGDQGDGHIRDVALEASADTVPGDVPQEPEESHLECRCTICNKAFKGKYLVAHAMFHYRNDQCMFCGTRFKDNILAMMHLSEHIEKLKKRKEPTQESHKAEAAGVKKSDTPETRSPSPARRRGRPRKSLSPEPPKPSESVTADSRALRSSSKLAEEPALGRNGKNVSESKTPSHKVNGHVGRRQEKHADTKRNARVKEYVKPPQHKDGDPKEKVRLKDDGKSSQNKNLDTKQKVKDVGKSWQHYDADTKQKVRLKDIGTTSQQIDVASKQKVKDDGKPSQHKDVDTRQNLRLKDVGKSLQHKDVAKKLKVKDVDDKSSQHKAVVTKQKVKDDGKPSRHKDVAKKLKVKDDGKSAQHKHLATRQKVKDDGKPSQHKDVDKQKVKDDGKSSQHKDVDTKQKVKDAGKSLLHKDVDTMQRVRLKDTGKPLQDKHVSNQDTVRLKEVDKAVAELSSTKGRRGGIRYPSEENETATQEDVSAAGAPLETERVSCPVGGCSWNADLSRNRVSLLYHALDHHYGDAEPLHLAYDVGNGRCGVCMRVTWSFQHYQHHVEGHRLAPRHPCLHRGCGARFKTGLEMRRHTRRQHSPLQAVCCVPGCPRLFICLWALNLHEREHYASKPSRTPPKTTPPAPDDKRRKDRPPVEIRPDQEVGGKVRGQNSTPLHPDGSGRDPKHDNTSCVLSSQALDNPPVANDETSPPNTDSTLLETQSKVRTTFAALSRFMRNLSSKDSPTKVFQQNFKKGQLTKNNATTHNHASANVSSPAASNSKVRTRLKDRQVKVKENCDKRSHHATKSTRLIKRACHKTPAATQKAAAKAENADQPKDQETLLSPPIPTVTPKIISPMSNTSEPLQKNRENTDEILAQDAVEMTATCNPAISTENPLTPKSVEEHSNSIPLPLVAFDSSKVTASPSEAITEETPLSIVEADIKGLNVTDNCSLPNDENTLTSVHDKTAKKKCKDKDCPPKDMQTSLLKPSKAKKRPRVDNSKAEAKMAKKKCTSKASLPKEKAKQSATDAKNAKIKSVRKPSRPKDAASDSAEVKKRPKPAKATANNVKPAKKKRLSPPPSVPSALGGDPWCETSAPVQPVTEVPKSLAGQDVEGKDKTCLQQRVSTTSSNGHAAAAARQPPVPPVWPHVGHRAYRPYIRPPPTTYLDEQHTTMPKKRKEMTAFCGSSSSPTPPPTHAQLLPRQRPVATATHRQRCASCFASFGGADELRTHLSLKKCSDLFGFDSDDEGNC